MTSLLSHRLTNANTDRAMPSLSFLQFAYQHSEQQNTETESKIENTLWQFDAIRTLAYTNEKKKIIENFIVRVAKVMRAIQTVRAHDVGGRCVYDRKFQTIKCVKTCFVLRAQARHTNTLGTRRFNIPNAGDYITLSS